MFLKRAGLEAGTFEPAAAFNMLTQFGFLLPRGSTPMVSAQVAGESSTEEDQAMTQPDQGIVRDDKGQEQPADKRRAQTVHKTDPRHSVSREATRDPKLNDASKTPGSGMTPDDEGGAPTG